MKLLSNSIKRKLSCLFVYSLFIGQVFAQTYFIGGDASCGHILCNDAESRQYINSPAYGFSVYMGRNHCSTDYWEYYWRNPSIGMEFSYDYIANSITGNRLGALLYFRPSVYKAEHLSVDVYMALGLSYLSKIHDDNANPANIYIGSHVNALINLGVQANYFLTERFALCTSVKFSHSSNGQLVRPNLGLNFLQIDVGAEYYLSGYDHYVAPVSERGEKKNFINISFSPAISQSRFDYKHYLGACVAVAYSRTFHPCFSYGLSWDFMYNGTNITSYSSKGSMTENFSNGFAANFECRLSYFALRVALGSYVWHGEYQKLPFYERAGLFYYIGKNRDQYLGVSIKAHAANAEYIEWTYGLSLGL